MRVSVFAYSLQGMLTGKRIISSFEFEEVNAYAPERIAANGYMKIISPSQPFYRERFLTSDLLVFVGSCGLAVRIIAPHLRSKETDPAVLCVDDMGQYVIPILSGHIGGANDYARNLSAAIHALPVITTATDIHRRFSVDSWAAQSRYIINNMSIAKEISAAILERDIPFSSHLSVSGPMPNGLYIDNHGKLGVFFGWEKENPFDKTLRIIPKCLHLGIGCRKGTDEQTIRNAVEETLSANNIDQRAVKCAASVDLKADEPGLLDYCSSAGLPFRCYSAEELQRIPGEFSHSDFVLSVTGVDNICERAAMMDADRLIVSKTVHERVTIAIAAEIKEVNFG